MAVRRHTLADCNPSWVTYDGKEDHAPDAIKFDCPEGHEHCYHIIPFTPALDGHTRPVLQRNGAQWERTNDSFATLSLTPSIRRIPSHASREAAIAAGCIPEFITESMLCAFHGFIKSGQIEFCGDSR